MRFIAPCGHPGLPVIGTFVLCRSAGCNGLPPPPGLRVVPYPFGIGGSILWRDKGADAIYRDLIRLWLGDDQLDFTPPDNAELHMGSKAHHRSLTTLTRIKTRVLFDFTTAHNLAETAHNSTLDADGAIEMRVGGTVLRRMVGVTDSRD